MLTKRKYKFCEVKTAGQLLSLKYCSNIGTNISTGSTHHNLQAGTFYCVRISLCNSYTDDLTTIPYNLEIMVLPTYCYDRPVRPEIFGVFCWSNL